MNIEDQNQNNLLNLQNEKDKRESFQRSPSSKKYVTIIAQDFYQKSELSLEAMGLIGYLMSLPDDWIIYNSHLQKVFKIGRDKLRKIMKELKEKGYMQRVPIKDDKGRIVTWHTQYSDSPEFLKLVQVTENPSPGNPPPGNPCPGKQPLQNNNNTNKQPYKKTTKQEPAPIQTEPKTQKPFHQIESSVVVALVEKLKQIGILETQPVRWTIQYGLDYVAEKLELTLSQAIENPAGFLNKAIANNWKKYLPNEVKPTPKPEAEKVYPTMEENKAWYARLSDEEKRKCYEIGVHKHSQFGLMIKSSKVDILNEEFLEHQLFKMLMQLVGRIR